MSKKVKNKVKLSRRVIIKARHELKRAEERKILKSLLPLEQTKRKKAIKEKVWKREALIQKAKDDKKRRKNE